MSKPKAQQRVDEAATNLPTSSVGGTSAPVSTPGAPTSLAWIVGGSTNAPTIGVPEPAEGYATSTANLAHRYLAGKVPLQVGTVMQLLPLLWFCATIWFFVQDNGAGTLSGWSGLRWTLVKSGILFSVALFAGVVHALVRWMLGRRD